MAAPPEVTIKDLSGKWIMNKTLSDDPDAVLALQGISWFMRRAIAWATITLSTTQYITPEDNVTHIDIEQTATGGIKGSTEKRTLDWTVRNTEDGMFGKLKGRTRWIGVSDSGVWGSVEGAPGNGTWHEPANDGEGLLGEFLTEGWLEGPGEEGQVGKSHVSSWVRNEELGWTAMQVWGFAELEVDVEGEGEDVKKEVKRFHVRRVVVKKEDEVLMIRLVYDWQGK